MTAIRLFFNMKNGAPQKDSNPPTAWFVVFRLNARILL